MNRRNVLFPIETINRELDFRLVLAVMLARRDRRIYLGQHDVVFTAAKYMQQGVVVGKNIFPQEFPWENLQRYRAVKERGIRVFWLDEEGGVFPGAEPDWERALKARVDVGVLDGKDFVAAWGDFQRDLYRRIAPTIAHRIETTGHPRFDLCRPQYRAYWKDKTAEIGSRLGRYVLVNTNLVLANAAAGLEYAFADFNGWDVKDAQKRTRHIKGYRHLTNLLGGMLSLINRLSIEFPDLAIVVRPHPSEDFEFYRTIFRGVPNVHVIHEGSVIPWIAASIATIHDGCTTGLEAFLGGGTVVNYKSATDESFDTYLPNAVGHQSTSEDDVVEVVRMTCAGKPPPHRDAPERARALLGNFSADAFAAVSGRIEFVLEETGPNHGFDEIAFRGFHARRRLAQAAKDRVRPFVPKRFLHQYSGPRWIQMFTQMYYGLDRKDVQRRIDVICKMLGKDVRARFFGRDLVLIEGE